MPRASLPPLLLLALLAPTAHAFGPWFQCILIIFFGIEYGFDSDTCMTEFVRMMLPPEQTMGLVTVCIGDDSQGIVSGTDPGLPHMRGRYGTNCGMDYGGLWFNPSLVGNLDFFPRRLAERALQQTPPIPSCWGNVSQGQDAWPSGAGFLETYAVGGSFVCGLYSSGLAPGVDNMTRELRCWGTGPGASPPSGLAVPMRYDALSEEEINDITTGQTRRRRTSEYDSSPLASVKLVAGQGHACITVDQFDRSHRRRRWNYSRRRGTYLRDEKSGFLACWGENSYGQADPCQWRAPWDDSNASAGCFGANAGGDAAAGWFPERVQNLALGLRHTCVLVQFYMQCWGDDTYGQLQNPYRANPFLPSTLAAGDYHTCGALGSFDEVRRLESIEVEEQRRLGGIGTEFVCWGRNDAGQTDVPVDVNNIVITAAAGAQHTCAYVWMVGLICWGSNSHGQTSVVGGFDMIFNLEAFDRGTCYTGFPTTTATTSTRSTSTRTTTTVSTVTSTTTQTVTTQTATTQTATTSTVTTTPWTSTATTTETHTTVTLTETSTETTTTLTSTQTVTQTSTATGTSTSRTSTVTSTLTSTSTVTSTGTETATTVTSTGTATSTATATSQTQTATSTTSMTATSRTGTATTRTGTATTRTGTATTVTGTETTVTGTATTRTATLTSTTQAPTSGAPVAAVTSPEPSTVTATTTKSGVQLKMSFTGVNCGMLMRDVAIQKDFIAALEQGIIASIADARITRQHIVTRIICRASSRRLQAGGGILDSESVINAQAAQVPVNEIQTTLDTVTASGTTKTNVETLVRDVDRIAEVTVTGQLPTVGPIIESALVEAITTTVTTTSGGCQMEICVEYSPTSAGSQAWLSMCVMMAVTLVP